MPTTIPKGSIAAGEVLDALLRRATESVAAFESMAGLKAVGEALRLARRLERPRAEAQALSLATICHYQRGDYVSAVASGLDACATFAANDLTGRSHALHGVALAFFTVSDFERAEEAARRAILYASLEGDSAQEAAARNVLGYALADAGRFDEALAEFRRARLRYRALGDVVRVKKTTSNAGHAWRKRGNTLEAGRRPAEAHRCWIRAMRFYRSALASGRSRLDDAIILGSLGECALRLGRADEALAHLAAAEGEFGPRDAARIPAHIGRWRGEAEFALGHRDRAEKHLRGALAAADQVENDELAVECREALARLAEASSQAEAAREWRDEARRTKESRRESLAEFRKVMRPLWARYLRENAKS